MGRGSCPGWEYSSLKNDGERGSFSPHDIALRRASAREDVSWTFGARGQLGYGDDTQGVQEQDVVFWYISHLLMVPPLGPNNGWR
jgi:hypothetical protein